MSCILAKREGQGGCVGALPATIFAVAVAITPVLLLGLALVLTRIALASGLMGQRRSGERRWKPKALSGRV